MLGVLIGLDFSANLVTMYVFYELMTLTSLPLVLHELTKEAVMAGLNTCFILWPAHSLRCSASFSWPAADGLTFTPGGVPLESTLGIPCRKRPGGRPDAGGGVLHADGLWDEGGHVSPARLAAHGPSGGSVAGQRGTVRR